MAGQELANTGGIDPGQLGGNVLVDPIVLNAATVGDLRAAFEHQTAGVYILHATPEGAAGSREFATLSLGLLAEVARTQPDAVDDQSRDSHGLFPMLAHWVNGAAHDVMITGSEITFSRRGADGYSEATGAEIAARKVTFLENLAQRTAQAAASPERRTDWRGEKDEPAHWFQAIAGSTIRELERAVVGGATVEIDATSDLGRGVGNMLRRQSTETAEAQARRTDALRGTVMDPEAQVEGLHTVEVRAGGHVSINLDGEPLLTGMDAFGFNHGQTAEAFYARRGGSDTGGTNIDGFTGKTVAMMEVEGRRYVVVDDRRAYGWKQAGVLPKNGSHRHADEREKGHVRILEIIGDGQEDPRYGTEVDEMYYDFHAGWRRGPQDIYTRGERYREATGVTVELDKRGQLVIATDKPIKVIAKEGVLTPERDTAPLSPDEALRHQVDEVTRRLDDLARYTERSAFTWPRSLSKGLARILAGEAPADGHREDGWISVSAGRFPYPERWSNEYGEMDSLNGFLGKMGAGNRDHVLARIRYDSYHREPRTGQQEPGGYVDFATGIDGVILRINYVEGDEGIESISPTIWLNPGAQIMV